MKKNFQQAFPFAGVVILLLALVITPPALTGFWHLSKAESLAVTNPEPAAMEFGFAARLLPWREDLWEKAGLSSLASEKPDLALSYLLRSSTLSSVGKLALGDSYFRLGNLRLALDVWEQLIDDGSLGSQVHNRLGHVYYEQGRYDDAIRSFSNAVKTDELDSDSYYMLGLLIATQEPEESLSPLIKAAQLDPKLDPIVQNLRGGLTNAMLSTDKAAQLTGAGRSLVSVGAWTLAKEAFENAIEANPHHAPAWAWLGLAKQVFQKNGLIEMARALELEKGSAEIRGLRAIYFLRDECYPEALAEFEAAAEIEPNDPEWLLSLGDTTARTGDVPKAMEYYRRAVELSPGSAEYWRAVADFTVDYGYGVQETGLPAALKARALAPEDPYNTVTLGRIFFAMGNLRIAEKTWLNALKVKPDIASAYLYLGVLYLQQGKYDSALQSLNTAVEIDGVGPYGTQASRMVDQYFP